MGDAGPEAADLEQQLGAEDRHEAGVAGGPPVLPDVVRDRDVDVPLVAAEVRQPPPRLGVEVHGLGFLAPVGAALPGEHRALVAGLGGRRLRLVEAPVAVAQQRVGQLRDVVVEQREDEQLVPEDVAAIGLAVPAAGRDADVEIDRVARGRLQQMEDVHPQDHLDALALVVEHHVAAPPQLFPRDLVAAQQVVEVAGPLGRGDGLVQRVRHGAVARGEQRDHLLDGHRLSGADLQAVDLGDVSLVDGRLDRGFDPLSGGVAEPGARAFGDLETRLRGFDQHMDAPVLFEARLLRDQMAVGELAVAGDAIVDDPPVEGRADLDFPAPVLRRDRHLDGRQMRLVHAHDAPAFDLGRTPLAVAETQGTGQDRFVDVELLPVGHDFDVRQVEPRPVPDPERQAQPVRHVDQVLVFDRVSGDLGDQPVVAARDIGAGVVRVLGGVGPFGGAAGAEIAVSEDGQGFAQAFLFRIESVIDECPTGHGGFFLRGQRARESSSLPASSGSATRKSASVGRSSLASSVAPET